MVGFAQLDPLGLPAHAAVAATVEAARALGRAPGRAGQRAVAPRSCARACRPAIRMRTGRSGCARDCRGDWPTGRSAILAASAHRPRRCGCGSNARRGTATSTRALQAGGIAATVDAELPDALRLDTPVPVARLPGFATGEVSVQDGAAQRVADASSWRRARACWMPVPRRAARPRTARTRSGAAAGRASRSTRRACGACAPASRGSAWPGAAACSRPMPPRCRLVGRGAVRCVLLDAPCSATGIVRRQPDVLLHRRESDSRPDRNAGQPARRAVAHARARRRLLYATCSILKAENDVQVAAFLARTPDAALEPLDGRFGRAVSVDGAVVGHQRLPGEDDGDGFFYARLRKR